MINSSPNNNGEFQFVSLFSHFKLLAGLLLVMSNTIVFISTPWPLCHALELFSL